MDENEDYICTRCQPCTPYPDDGNLRYKKKSTTGTSNPAAAPASAPHPPAAGTVTLPPQAEEIPACGAMGPSCICRNRQESYAMCDKCRKPCHANSCRIQTRGSSAITCIRCYTGAQQTADAGETKEEPATAPVTPTPPAQKTGSRLSQNNSLWQKPSTQDRIAGIFVIVSSSASDRSPVPAPTPAPTITPTSLWQKNSRTQEENAGTLVSRSCSASDRSPAPAPTLAPTPVQEVPQRPGGGIDGQEDGSKATAGENSKKRRRSNSSQKPTSQKRAMLHERTQRRYEEL